MKILSRGQLMELIENNPVETILVDSSEGKRIVNTIIHENITDTFYKLTWGAIEDGLGEPHIWFKEDAEKVELNLDGVWVTKSEFKKYRESKLNPNQSPYLSSLPLTNIEFNIINNKGSHFKYVEDEIEVVDKIGKSLDSGKSVLVFSTESNDEQILSKIIKSMTKDSYVRLNNDEANYKDLDKINNAINSVLSNKFKIECDDLLDSNYIKELMCEQADSKHGLDLVVIDNLKLTVGNSGLSNFDSVKKILRFIDVLARKLSCHVIVSVELKSDLD